MRKHIRILFLFSLLPLGVFAQTTTKTDPQNIKVNNTRDPEYPKGEQALYQEVMMNVKYPPESIQRFVEGMVELSFDVKTDSTVANCVILKGIDTGVDEAVKKYVEKLKFAPARQNGVLVKMNVDMSFPVKAH
ncbi:MAG TPA: energy transducer TonB [Bacteroidia bacterium]|jgi:TonB family protein|nr:energy transducer TonB [Bacteroidia bacterium]